MVKQHMSSWRCGCFIFINRLHSSLISPPPFFLLVCKFFGALRKQLMWHFKCIKLILMWLKLFLFLLGNFPCGSLHVWLRAMEWLCSITCELGLTSAAPAPTSWWDVRAWNATGAHCSLLCVLCLPYVVLVCTTMINMVMGRWGKEGAQVKARILETLSYSPSRGNTRLGIGDLWGPLHQICSSQWEEQQAQSAQACLMELLKVVLTYVLIL